VLCKVNAVVEALTSLDRDDLALGVKGIQEQERLKLQMTATLHVLRKAQADKERRADANDAIGELDPNSDTAHTHHGGKQIPCRGLWCHGMAPKHEQTFVHAGGCACGHPPLEPTQEELRAAIAEATQNIQTAVCEINDLMEELRYEMSDSGS